MNTQDQEIRANSIIKSHVMLSMGAGLVPIPLLDIAAVTAVQLDMLKQLARLYDLSFDEHSGKSLVLALTGSTLARLGASVIKAIPGIGSIFGGISMAGLSGASTYGIGQVFNNHFSAGGNFTDFDPSMAKTFYEKEFEKGKEFAAKWKKEKGEKQEPEPASNPKTEEEDVLQKLEKLGELKEKGVISAKEFQEMKKKLMGEF